MLFFLLLTLALAIINGEEVDITGGPPCIDSPYKATIKVAGDGTKILLSCKDIDVGFPPDEKESCQRYEMLATHCPKSCLTCDPEMLADSKATFFNDDVKGETMRCKEIRKLPKKKREKRCANNESLRMTCRASCNYGEVDYDPLPFTFGDRASFCATSADAGFGDEPPYFEVGNYYTLRECLLQAKGKGYNFIHYWVDLEGGLCRGLNECPFEYKCNKKGDCLDSDKFVRTFTVH